MARNKMSPQSAVDLFAAIVAASGGSIASYSLSASHVGAERNKKARKSLEEEKKEWTPPDPVVRTFFFMQNHYSTVIQTIFKSGHR